MKKRKKTAVKQVKPTLKDLVAAAQEAGATVTLSLVPLKPERLRLALPSEQWPGTPYTRSSMAAMDYTDKDVAQVFKDNPTSLWIVTPYEIIERSKFFAPKPAPTPEVEQSTSNPS